MGTGFEKKLVNEYLRILDVFKLNEFGALKRTGRNNLTYTLSLLDYRRHLRFQSTGKMGNSIYI